MGEVFTFWVIQKMMDMADSERCEMWMVLCVWHSVCGGMSVYTCRDGMLHMLSTCP